MLVTGLFIKMSNGATYSVVPFINPRALGAVSGIVGAGGNLGAVAAGFLFKTKNLTWPQALLVLGVLVLASSSLAILVSLSQKSIHDRSHKAVTHPEDADAEIPNQIGPDINSDQLPGPVHLCAE
jgi:nitrate/nitrite transporter NarK